MPFEVNPERGYIVNANNIVGPPSKNPHGIGYAFSMNTRAARITELLENLIKESGNRPIRVTDIQVVQKDTLDIQARSSLKQMLACVEAGMTALSSEAQEALKSAQQKLKVWDFKFEVGSIGAAIFEAWEFRIVSHMHEKKIEDVRVRRSIFANSEA